MSTVSATPAQRITARDKCFIASDALQAVAQNSFTPSADEGAAIDVALVAAATALGALGASAALPSTSFVLNSGVKVNAVAVTGTGNFATPTIVGGVITGIVLSAS